MGRQKKSECKHLAKLNVVWKHLLNNVLCLVFSLALVPVCMQGVIVDPVF